LKDIRNATLDEIGLSPESCAYLRRAGLLTEADIERTTVRNLLNVKGMSSTIASEIVEKLCMLKLLS